MDRDELRHHMKIQIGGMSIRQWCRLNKCNVSHVAAFLQGKKGPPGDMLRALNLRVDYVAISQQAEARAEGLSSELECAGRNVARLQKHLGQEIALGERLVAALEKIELMDTDYTLGPDHNLEIARDIARDALTAYRSGRP